MAQKQLEITYAQQISLVTLSSLPCSGAAVARVLTAFSQSGINLDMISQTAPQGGTLRLSFTLSDQFLAPALTLLGTLQEGQEELKPEVLPGNAKLSFYDAQMVNTPGVAARLLSLLSQAGIEVMLITTSDVDISLLVCQHALGDALRILAEEYGSAPQERSFR